MIRPLAKAPKWLLLGSQEMKVTFKKRNIWKWKKNKFKNIMDVFGYMFLSAVNTGHRVHRDRSSFSQKLEFPTDKWRVINTNKYTDFFFYCVAWSYLRVHVHKFGTARVTIASIYVVVGERGPECDCCCQWSSSYSFSIPIIFWRWVCITS
jgi:hypothetical protein